MRVVILSAVEALALVELRLVNQILDRESRSLVLQQMRVISVIMLFLQQGPVEIISIIVEIAHIMRFVMQMLWHRHQA